MCPTLHQASTLILHVLLSETHLTVSTCAFSGQDNYIIVALINLALLEKWLILVTADIQIELHFNIN